MFNDFQTPEDVDAALQAISTTQAKITKAKNQTQANLAEATNDLLQLKLNR